MYIIFVNLFRTGNIKELKRFIIIIFSVDMMPVNAALEPVNGKIDRVKVVLNTEQSPAC